MPPTKYSNRVGRLKVIPASNLLLHAWCMGCKTEVELTTYITAPRFGGGWCARGVCPVCGGQVCKALPAGEKEDEQLS